MPVRVIVCHWSRTRPVLRRNGNAGCTSAASGSGATKRALRSGVKKPPCPNSRAWRGAVSPGTAIAPAPSRRRRGHRARRAHRCRNRACRCSRRQRAPRARGRRRPRSEYAKAASNPSRCATCVTIHQSGRASPGSGRNARWREMRRSELVTVPSFSPHAAAGSRTCAPLVMVSLVSTLSDTTNSSSLLSAARTAPASRERDRRIGRHHPQGLDLALRDRLEHRHGLETLVASPCAARSRTDARDRSPPARSTCAPRADWRARRLRGHPWHWADR